MVVVDDGSHVPAHVRETFAIVFPLLPDGAIYCIEDTQTSYWPAWGGQLDPRARGTSMDMVKDLVDGLNHEELLVEGYEPTYTDTHVRAVHCYHNLVVIEKGDNREGTNRDTSSGHFHGTSPDPAADPGGDRMTVLLATFRPCPHGEPGTRRSTPPWPSAGSTPAGPSWDDPAVDWAAADLVAVRSTWDYATRAEEFLDWARSLDQARLLNGADVFAWNHDKAYLTDLGPLPVVPTRLASSPAESAAAIDEFGTRGRQAARQRRRRRPDRGLRPARPAPRPDPPQPPDVPAGRRAVDRAAARRVGAHPRGGVGLRPRRPGGLPGRQAARRRRGAGARGVRRESPGRCPIDPEVAERRLVGGRLAGRALRPPARLRPRRPAPARGRVGASPSSS